MKEDYWDEKKSWWRAIDKWAKGKEISEEILKRVELERKNKDPRIQQLCIAILNVREGKDELAGLEEWIRNKKREIELKEKLIEI
jgi:hypothetical protein